MEYPLIPNKINNISLSDYQHNQSQWQTGEIYSQRVSYLLNGLTLVLNHNINQGDLATLLNFYNSVYGSLLSFELPENFYKMPEAITSTIANLNPLQKWKFANPFIARPIVATKIRGWYQVDVTLKMVIR